MEREFDAYKLSRSMYASSLSSTVCQLFEPQLQKNRRFHVPQAQPTFLFPLETPLRLSRNMLYGWKDNSMLAKPLAACTYLSSIVSVSLKIVTFTTFLFPLLGDAPEAITLNVVWMEREFDAYKLSRSMYLSNYSITVSEIEWDICEKNRHFIISPCIRNRRPR